MDGPDVRKLMRSEEFENVLEGHESIAWDSIKAVITTLLGKNRSENYSVFVKDMIDSFHKLGISMTLKIHFLHRHLDRLVNQLATESDEQGERFHQTILPMETRFKGKKIDSMLGEVCWWSHIVYKFKRQHTDTDGNSNDDEAVYFSDTSDSSN